MGTLTIVFIFLLLIYLLIELWLGHRHINHVRGHSGQVPPEFADKISLEEHKKSAKYTIAKKRLSLLNTVIGAVLLLLWTVGGGFEWLDKLWRNFDLDMVWTGIGFLISVSVLMSILDLPLSLYGTFILEEKFGFNKTTIQTFVADMFKSLFLGLLIGVPILWLILWLIYNVGDLWWFWVWAAWLGFAVLMMWLYPAFIAPWFNKFEPLEKTELRELINKLLTRTGFSSSGIFVMDGSKRSGHGNAYFTGFGNNKRIVFFDTLLDSLSDSEVEAVLAHELGHFKRNHIKKRIVLMALTFLAGFFILGFLYDKLWFYNGLGVSTKSGHAALILFFAVVPIVGFFTGPLLSYLSRKHEYEADAFAVSEADGNSLISALVNMYKDNASTLTPDPLHSLVHDSHPPAPLRIEQIRHELSLKSG